MNKKSRISKDLYSFLQKNRFRFDFQSQEHYGCWDRGCSHFVEVLVIRKNKQSFEFAECSDDFIKKILHKHFDIKCP